MSNDELDMIIAAVCIAILIGCAVVRIWGAV